MAERNKVPHVSVGVVSSHQDDLFTDLKPETGGAAEISRGRGARQRLGTLEESARDLIIRTLKAMGGNKAQAAKELGFVRRTLYNKIA